MVMASAPMSSCAIKEDTHRKLDLEVVREEAVCEKSYTAAFLSCGSLCTAITC